MKRPRIEPRFDECLQCEHFKRTLPCRYSKSCNAGEFFEEKMRQIDPDRDVHFHTMTDEAGDE